MLPVPEEIGLSPRKDQMVMFTLFVGCQEGDKVIMFVIIEPFEYRNLSRELVFLCIRLQLFHGEHPS